MVKKLFLAGIVFSIISAGCTDLFLNNKGDDNWILKQSGNSAIYYRPANYTGTPSPSEAVIDTMLINQNYFYSRILDTLKVRFTGTVMVYLYNYDEAKEMIGTNGGGHGTTEFLTYHYTYFYQYTPVLKIFGRKDRLGAHELIHILADNTIGQHGSKLFSEGLAVFLDNTYGGKYIDEIMKIYYTSNRTIPINSMIENGNTDESLYYPNAGSFIRYLASVYGISAVKQLYTIPPQDLSRAFSSVTGRSIDEIQTDYNSYCRLKYLN